MPTQGAGGLRVARPSTFAVVPAARSAHVGYTSRVILLVACAAPLIDADGDGAAVPMDCDDADATVFPAAGETCANGVDDDCDGGAAGCGVVGNQWLGDATLRVSGTTTTELEDAAILSTGELAVLGDDGTVERGLWIVPAGEKGEIDLDTVPRTAGAGGAATLGGGEVLSLVNVGDGGPGWISLHHLDAWASPFATLTAPSALRAADAQLVSDATGDAEVDLVLADRGAVIRSNTSGAIWVFPGPFVDTMDLRGSGVRIPATRAGAFLGAFVRPADLDGDGIVDLAYLEDLDPQIRLGPDFGAAEPDGVFDLATQTLSLEVGDVDGDGAVDVFVGCPVLSIGVGGGDAYNGAALLFLGPVQTDRPLTDDDAAASVSGPVGEHSAGSLVGLPGDVDGDGHADFVLDGSYASRAAVYVVAGPLEGTTSASDASGIVMGRSAMDGVGAVGGAPDMDGDGTDELFIRGHESSVSAAWLFHGGPGF